MTAFLILRIYQIKRYAIEIGFFRTIVIALMFLFFFLRINSFIVDSPAIFYGAALLGIGFIHFGRNDKRFLLILNFQHKRLFILEYHLLNIPFYIISIYHEDWKGLVLLFIGISIIPFLVAKRRLFNKRPFNFSRFLPSTAIEWHAGLRKNYLLLAALYILILIFSKEGPTIPIGIIALSILSTFFYLEAEPRHFLEVFEWPPKKFIQFKIKNQLLILGILILPLILLYLLFYPEYWYILAAMIIIGFTLQIISITLKYATYVPNQKLEANSFLIGLSVLFFIIPFSVPVPFIMAFRYYNRAVRNLKYYLNAYH